MDKLITKQVEVLSANYSSYGALKGPSHPSRGIWSQESSNIFKVISIGFEF